MIFGLFKTMYFFILHFEVRNLGYIIRESFHRHQNGSLIAVAVKINLRNYQRQEVLCLVVRDIRDRKQAEEELQYQLLHDPLTNLPNRQLFK